MHKQSHKKLTFEFPADEYVYLKMACAKKGVSMKQFVNSAVIKSIEEYEDELDLKVLSEITDEDRSTAISWDEMEKKVGWDKL